MRRISLETRVLALVLVLLFAILVVRVADAGLLLTLDDCVLELDDDEPQDAFYAWTLAHGGSGLMSGRGHWVALNDDPAIFSPGHWTEVTFIPAGQPLTCADLGIDPQELARARWLSVVRIDSLGRWRGRAHREAPTGPVCNADLDGDGVVGASDLTILRRSFFATVCGAARCKADLNGDGVVNPADLTAMREVYFGICPARE